LDILQSFDHLFMLIR